MCRPLPAIPLVFTWNNIMHPRLFPRRLLTICLCALCLLLAIPVLAQDKPPAPQFLYRDENHLILVNGYTGEGVELPFEVSEQDHFEWAADGKYLLTRIKSDEAGYCLKLYDVDQQTWVYDEPISCGVQDSLLASDGSQLVYISDNGTNRSVELYRFSDQTNQELYRTMDADSYLAGISGIDWSPTENYLTFVSYQGIMGGTLNTFVVMNTESHDYFTLNAPDPYYAYYSPIWSDDDQWFLITLQEEYVVSATIPRSNHQGDVYLVNAETGESYRLTYTPAVFEGDVRWTDDGRIHFTEVIEQEHSLTIDQAMNVEVVPREAIVRPEPIDEKDFIPTQNSGFISPDPQLIAWVSSHSNDGENWSYQLNFGERFSGEVNFSLPIPEPYEHDNILIGWRPTDYVYPQE